MQKRFKVVESDKTDRGFSGSINVQAKRKEGWLHAHPHDPTDWAGDGLADCFL